MSLRILHVLDHSLPLHSGYSFRTLAILREQRAEGELCVTDFDRFSDFDTQLTDQTLVAPDRPARRYAVGTPIGGASAQGNTSGAS